ncbi:Hypothetical protein PHPALM_20066 [Phytophthora palmivora]|uniref:HTH CENPB-type domain-containing protein n=1 Tax=Phytophthora palmivora TaxID=4796 RepID=A0A2P4XFS0_9STRA|nr:Hypothetical protein PHPALM_20066 [Phytophthora palmivora]
MNLQVTTQNLGQIYYSPILETLVASRRAGITAAEKLAMFDAWEQSGNIGAVMQAFYSVLNEHTSEQRLEKEAQRHRAGARGLVKTKARQSGTGTVLLPEAERELVVWINELRGEGVPISAVMLHLQALEVAAAFNKPDF